MLERVESRLTTTYTCRYTPILTKAGDFLVPTMER